MFARILVPLDGSRLAERALQPALELAKSGMGELILLRTPEAKTMLEPSEFGRWVHGSVTGKVLRAGCCSMLIVPARFEDPTEALDAELGREHFDTPQPIPNSGFDACVS